MSDEITKTGSTSKSQSQLPNQPTPPADYSPADLDAEIAALQEKLKAKKALRDAEAIKGRLKKQAEAKARELQETEAFTEACYKICYRAKDRTGGFDTLKAVIEEFRINAITQRYTLAAMKERREARILAEAKKAEATLAK